MKATLEYNLPEEWEEYSHATRGHDVVTAVRRYLYNLRMKQKHEIHDDEEARIVERCRGELIECLDEQGVTHLIY
jgi:hypothetical protein